MSEGEESAKDYDKESQEEAECKIFETNDSSNRRYG